MPRALARLTRWRAIVVVVVVALLGGGSALAATKPWQHKSNAATTQVVAARMTTIVQTVAASGTIAPAKQADLDFAVSGRVTHVRVEVGDVVRKGQALAVLGTEALEAQRAAAEATVSADLEKVGADAPGSAVRAADDAALVAARSALHNAATAVRNATLKATINGTVTAVNLSVGQQVGAGSNGATQNGDSSAQVSLQSTSTFVASATVDDTQISEIKSGQAVAVTPEGASAPVAGTVTSVSALPSSSAGVVSFPVTVALTGHPTDVYAGSSATMQITTSKAVNVLAIPTLAITYSGSTATVEVKSGDNTEKRTITVGQTYGLQTAVKSGITAGERVVVRIPTFTRPSGGGAGPGTFTRGNGGFGGGPPGGGTFTQSFGGN